MRERDIARASELPLFEATSPRTLSEIIGGAFLQRFPAGTTLLSEGDPVDFLYVLFEGRVELQGAWKDRESTLALLQPVSTFALAATVLDAPALMSVRTIERSEILMLPGEALRRALKVDAGLGLAVAQEMAGCYRGVVRAIKNQKLRGGVERVANYLWSRRVRDGGADRITLPYEKRLIASLLDMTPETLSRAFLALSKYGVEVHGQEVTFSKPQALERLARPTPLIDNHMPPQERAVGKSELERWSPPAKQAAARA